MSTRESPLVRRESGLSESWRGVPTAGQYASALQHPALCFRDPWLQQCTTTRTPLGQPASRAGSHSIVVPLRTPGGERFAAKLFTRAVPDRARRYREIAAFLRGLAGARLSQAWNLETDFVAEGVLVEDAWYPLVTMRWAEGEPLNAWLDAHHDEREAVDEVAGNFLNLVHDLARLGIAHGDFHHGNILVADDLTLRLIDYDGMFVPALAGLPGVELGLEHYQHPTRRPEDFGPDLDRFSAHLIYLSLLAVARDPAIWPQFHLPDADYLILESRDLRSPATSARLLVLACHPDRAVATQCALLIRSLRLPAQRSEGSLKRRQIV